MSGDSSALPSELPLLVGAGGGQPEELLLIGASHGDRVTVRRWSSDDWSASPDARHEDSASLLRWIEAQAASGRTMNQSLYALRLWLRGEGTAPRTR